MELNEFDSPDHENASVSLKVVLLIFALVVVGALGYMVYAVNTTPTSDSGTVLTNKTTDSLVYANKTYKFTLTFNSLWKGYKVLADSATPTGSTAVYHVTMPTTSTDTNFTTAGTEHAAKYAKVFDVNVMTQAQWKAADQTKYGKMGETTTYVYAYSFGSGFTADQTTNADALLPTDLKGKGLTENVKTVAATFKTTK